jgi:hypothetical protein
MAVIVPDYTSLARVTPLNHRGADIAELATGNATITHRGRWQRDIPDGTLTADRELTLDHTGMLPNWLWVIRRLDDSAHSVTLKQLSGATICVLDAGLRVSVLLRLDERGLEQVGAMPLL